MEANVDTFRFFPSILSLLMRCPILLGVLASEILFVPYTICLEGVTFSREYFKILGVGILKLVKAAL
jgi:hypothetical protein